MGDYYIYNGRLYSSDELTHFKLGFIKPGHKWITREKAPAGSKKNWIYTYANKAKTAVVQEHQGNKYDELAAEMEAEIQEKYGNARTMSPAQIEDYNKKKAALDYYKSQASKSREKSKKIDKEVSKGIANKASEISLSDKVKNFLKHPFNKIEREKAIEKGKEEIIKKAKQEVTKAKQATKDFKTNALTKEQRVEKEVKRQERIKADKEAAKVKAAEYRQKQHALEKLRNDPNKVEGLDIQKNPTTSAINQKRSNPHYNDTDASYQLYHENCSNCSVAYDMRERGYDVEARSNSYNERYMQNDDIYEMIENGLYEGDNITIVGAGAGSSGQYQLEWHGDERKYTIGHNDPTTNKLLQKSTVENSKDIPKEYQTWTPYVYNAGDNINNKTYLDNLEKEMIKGGEGSRGIFQCAWSHDGKRTGGHSMAYEVRNGEVVIIDAQTNKTYKIEDFYTNSYNQGFLRTDNLTPTDKIKEKVE